MRQVSISRLVPPSLAYDSDVHYLILKEPQCGVSHDSSMGDWMNPTVCPPCGPSSIPSRGWVFQGIFPWLLTLCQPILSQRPGSISPQWHHATCGQRGGRPQFYYGQTMAEEKKSGNIGKQIKSTLNRRKSLVWPPPTAKNLWLSVL